MHKRFAVMLHHGLGDVICALPALQAVDQALGRAAEIDLIVKSTLEAGVLASVPWRAAVRIHTLRAGQGVRRILGTLGLAWRLRQVHPTAFLAVHVTSIRLARAMARLVDAESSIVAGSGGVTRGEVGIEHRFGEHKVIRYARFFSAAGVPIDLDGLSFPSIAAARDGRTYSARSIVVAPAVGAVTERHKQWPETRVVELVEGIARRWTESRILLVAAPSEAAVLQRVFDQLSGGARIRTHLQTPETPVFAAAAMVNAACVVTCCSGASHLAAWAGPPIVGIYGPTNPGYTGAYSRRLHVVRKELACAPCYRPGFLSGCVTPVCMTAVSASEVLDAIGRAIDGDIPPPVPFYATTGARRPASVSPADGSDTTLGRS